MEKLSKLHYFASTSSSGDLCLPIKSKFLDVPSNCQVYFQMN